MGEILKTRNIIGIIVMIFFIGVTSGCSNDSNGTNKDVTTQGSKVSLTNITPKDAKKRLDSEEKIILLDVRTIEEYESGHIKDSILIPVDNLEEESKNTLKDKDIPLFVYCRSGSRSLTAANILIKQGYNNVYNLGGINEWPYDVVK